MLKTDLNLYEREIRELLEGGSGVTAIVTYLAAVKFQVSRRSVARWIKENIK